MKRFRFVVALIAILLLPVNSYAQFSTIDNITIDAASGGVNASISGDGRYIVFESESSDIVPGDTNAVTDIFLYDRQLDSYERVSVDSFGNESNDESFEAIISGNGEYVVFESNATNLVVGDTNGAKDVFVYTVNTQAVERVSVDDLGGQSDDASGTPYISNDGRYVTFISAATNLVLGDTNGMDDVFVYDRNTDTIEDITIAGDDTSEGPVITPNGRYVAFSSASSNLVLGDTNSTYDVFVYDRTLDSVERVSIADAGTEGDNGSERGSLISISDDARYVAFNSESTNLVSSDLNSLNDVFVYDRTNDEIERVSVATDGTESDGHSDNGIISPNGRFVFFVSGATNLVPAGELNDFKNVFVRDLSLGLTSRVSISEDATEQGNGQSLQVTPRAFSDDGKTLIFQTDATNFTGTDTNSSTDVMVAVLSDNDGVSPTVEDAAPNSGDVNESDVPDSIEHNISSLLNSVTGEYTAVVSTGSCFDNEDVGVIPESSLGAEDPQFNYPVGIADFGVNCRTALGDSATITIYFFGVDAGDFSLRKINDTTGVSEEISSYTLTPVTIGGESALKVEYDVTDGSSLDEDGVANGIIIDPVGLAVADTSHASSGGGVSSGSRPHKKLALLSGETIPSKVCHVFTTNMKMGSKMGEVAELQNYLNANGFNSGLSDGWFGKLTLSAMKNFQTSKGLLSDGIVGPMTRAKLNECK